MAEYIDRLPNGLASYPECQSKGSLILTALEGHDTAQLVDTFYPTPQTMLAWTYDRTIRAANTKLYRAVARVARPSLLLRVAASAHGLFQRGTDLSVEFTQGVATSRLSHPAFLHGGFNHLSNVAMFEGLLMTAGATDPKCEMTESEPGHAVYVTTWS